MRFWFPVGVALALSLTLLGQGAGAAGPASSSSVRIFVQENPSAPAGVGEPIDLSAFAFGNLGPSTHHVTFSLPAGAPSWVTLVPGSGGGTAIFTAARPGVYHIEASALGKTDTITLDVYGPPAAVTLAPQAASLAADGAGTDSVAVSVVDANGTQVTGFDGSVQISDRWGLLCQGSAASDTVTVAINQGQGTAQLCAPGAAFAAADHLTAADLTRYGEGSRVVAGVHYGRATVSLVRAVPSGVRLLDGWGGDHLRVAGKGNLIAFGPTYVSPGQSVPLTLAALDQDSQPIGADVTVQLHLTGPGSLSGTGHVTQERVRLAGEAPVTVYTEAGHPGTVQLQAQVGGATNGNADATFTVEAVAASTGARLRIVVSRAIDNAGMPYNLYDVMVVGADGRPVPSATGTLAVSDNSGTLATSDPLARLFGRTTASVLFATAGDAAVDANYAPLAPGSPLTVPVVDGSAAFAVVTGAAAAVPVRLTVTDAALGTSLTPSYVWSPGQPTDAVVSARAGGHGVECGLGLCALSAAPGQAVTLSAQVTDAHGNPVPEAGLPVRFVIQSPGGTFATGRQALWALTNAQGAATATLTSPTAPGAQLRVTAAFDQHVGAGGAIVLETTHNAP